MKFKVGDKVRIREDSPKIGWNISGRMDEWIGKIMTIKAIINPYIVFMEEDQDENYGLGWLWCEEDFEKAD